jgi:cyclopropane fatty-acyl-phospholipid synthase-like methyltransferase
VGEARAYFGFQAILRNRVPRARRQDIADLKFTADVIFPGGLNPRLEELVAAVNPYWEIVELKTRRTDYGKTTGEWLRRMRLHEKTHPREVGRPGLRRLRPLPVHLRARLRQPLVERRADEAAHLLMTCRSDRG